MTSFDDGFGPSAPPAVRPVVTDPVAWAASAATLIKEHVQARGRLPIFQEPPIVGMVGALLGVLPLREAAYAILSAMNMPNSPRDVYAPGAVGLAGFADAVNRANRKVYEYATECWYARRAVVVDWNRDVVTGSEEWAAGVAVCAVVVAEAEAAECRLARYERGLRRVTEAAEAALGNMDLESIKRLTGEIEAAGQEYSMPPETVSSEF